MSAPVPPPARPADRGAPIILVMGVAGSGKTTIGALLAGRLGCTYAEADDFHPKANIEKMAAGHPLTDADRWPWLEAIARWIDERRASGTSAVVSCSALKRSYRDMLAEGRPEVEIVYLKGDRDLILRRLTARHGHFMKAEMLDSQFADLEEPGPNEHALVVPIDGTPDQVVGQIMARLGLPG